MNDDEGSGWLLFASVVLVVAGVMRFFDGLYLLRHDSSAPELLQDGILGDDLAAYGWLWLFVGITLVLAGVLVNQRSQLARWVGMIAGAFLTVTASFYLPFDAVWALVYIFIGVFIIYGLAVYGGRDSVDTSV
jgi:uncharacterized membrane protein HdeD (DUF308 family)